MKPYTAQAERSMSADHDGWPHSQASALASTLAALLHDIGKASTLFQNKLRKKPSKGGDPYRHEWVSLRIFQAMIHGSETDHDWLSRLSTIDSAGADDWEQHIDQYNDAINPQADVLKGLPPFAQLVGWLILSHHYLPTPLAEKGNGSGLDHRFLKSNLNTVSASWNSYNDKSDPEKVASNWHFKHGIPTRSASWAATMRSTATEALALVPEPSSITELSINDTPFVSHISRLCLMWADHYYSSLPADPSRGDKRYPLYANTDTSASSQGKLKQRLDEHLLGVAEHSEYISAALPTLKHQLSGVTQVATLEQSNTIERFVWQDKAYALSRKLRALSESQGFFGVNMASTGCGKTIANARIMYGLSDPVAGARFSVALGLRTLTLQTGDEYRKRLQLGSDNVAVLTGGQAVQQLHERGKGKDAPSDLSGSESSSPLFGADHHVDYDGGVADGPFNQWLTQDRRLQKLLNAPLLCCTIDHLMPAVEGVRGGKQIAPMLRLLTSDLVLDEPDDFGLDDTPALARLVYFAGLLGSRVLLSSATLPPALVRGLFSAYLAGREGHQKSCGNPGADLNVPCAWFDEYGTSDTLASNGDQFEDHHKQFVDGRLNKLLGKLPRVNAAIAGLKLPPHDDNDALYPAFAEMVVDKAKQLHGINYSHCETTGKNVSFGIVRMANIAPLYEVCKAIYNNTDDDIQIHLCCYHSRHPLLVRSEIERTLDETLKRKEPKAVFSLPDVRDRLQASPKANHIFLVAATAVAEVGRDHDYDWAIIEPSSMRSIIQLAGRVRRHRPEPYSATNIALLDRNIRDLRFGKSKPAFCWPGFEHEQMMLSNHDLSSILRPHQYQPLNASSRISEESHPEPNSNLVDLEHDRVRSQMGLPSTSNDRLIPRFWTTAAHATSVFQKDTPFRKGGASQTFALSPDGSDIEFTLQEPDGSYTEQGELFTIDRFTPSGSDVTPWATVDFQDALEALASERNEGYERVSRLFGTIELDQPNDGRRTWLYHPWLGLTPTPQTTHEHDTNELHHPTNRSTECHLNTNR